MGRGYTRREYLDLVAQLRQARPDLALSTDLIAGFPGETEEEFRLTLELLEEVRFSAVYAFTYSPRPGTAAPRLGGAVDPGVASERLQRLFAAQETIQGEINASLVGHEFEVLVTGWGKQPGIQVGRTSCHRVILFEAGPEPAALGGVIRVQVGEAFAYGLRGRRLPAAVAAR
jgi:tRNA-2-methylthio-N6-dimethylallyladenosine synthase